jgi:hypothetical protein
MSALLSRPRFSCGFRWTVAAILLLVAIPFILDFLSLPVLTYRGDSKMQYRDFHRYAGIMEEKLQAAPTTSSLPFPGVLRQEIDLRRARLFTTFIDIPNLRTAAPSVVICTSKKLYREGRLVLLRDGTVSFMRGDGSLVPYQNK